MARKTVIVYVNDKMQRGYTYVLTVRSGRNFDPEFRPELTPKEMLALGVFCGKYMTDCRDEFPASWFARARLSPSGRNCSLNYFGDDASQSLAVWRCKGWINRTILRGWFQWYCRYYMGRRMPGHIDQNQTNTASLVIPGVDRASAKLCCTGPMTTGRFEANVQGALGILRRVATNDGLRGALHRAPSMARAGPPSQQGYRISCDPLSVGGRRPGLPGGEVGLELLHSA